jgi:hypothetical protein
MSAQAQPEENIMSDIAATSLTANTHTPPKWLPWAGRAASALVVLGLAASAAMKLQHSPELVGMFTGKLGYPESTLQWIAIVELLCAIVYAVPQTAVLGAILVTGYLGGAVATHVRVEDPFVAPLLLGVFAWLGLFLRDARLRALLPLARRS